MRTWLPLSCVNGGPSGTALVNALRTQWGVKLFSRIAIANVSASVYKDRDAIIKGLRDSVRKMVRPRPGPARPPPPPSHCVCVC